VCNELVLAPKLDEAEYFGALTDDVPPEQVEPIVDLDADPGPEIDEVPPRSCWPWPAGSSVRTVRGGQGVLDVG
jgi:hypothetical protein